MDEDPMNSSGWTNAATILTGFGGESITLHVSKTGLPFFDALRLYGAIDLYIGIREDVEIHDKGNEWVVSGQVRANRLAGKDVSAFNSVWRKKKPVAGPYLLRMRESLTTGAVFQEEAFAKATGALIGLDAALQAGIRGSAAHSYETLQSGQTSKSECLSHISLSQGLLAFAGKKRTETLGNIVFLPIFEGTIDFSKVVAPIRAWIGLPNVLCSQALALLALKSSLFSEGYEERLTAVTFNTDLPGQRSDNYSGLVAISCTAIGKMKSPDLVSHTYRVFRNLVGRAWLKRGRDYQSTPLTPHALAMAYWLMQPASKHLAAMITSQERARRERFAQLFTNPHFVKEVFQMSYGSWQGDHEAVRKLAKAVASGILYARMKDDAGRMKDDPQKDWYDEVTLLRSAPRAKAFVERAMILIEQGHRKHSMVGTAHWNQAFDPAALTASIGQSPADFETFRDLFRMYLVQESTFRTKDETTADTLMESDIEAAEPKELDKENSE